MTAQLVIGSIFQTLNMHWKMESYSTKPKAYQELSFTVTITEFLHGKFDMNKFN